MSEGRLPRLSRRGFLRLAAAGVSVPVVVGLVRAGQIVHDPSRPGAGSLPGGTSSRPARELEEATIGELQAAMQAGRLDSRRLVAGYLQRIQALDREGPALRAVLDLNPDANRIAGELDDERRAGRVRGPLHGIPVLVKGNIDTADAMPTTAGSLALLGSRPARDAPAVTRLREAGAVVLGKTNLSEWMHMRSTDAPNGWSARGGQTRNPYATDRTPRGSSSGSAVAAAASLATVAIGTETDGSIVNPAAANGVVGLKPTVGLTSRAGVIPAAASQDSVGVLGRTVADVAAVLTVLAGPDPRDPATLAVPPAADYRSALRPDGLRGARIGIPRWFYGLDEATVAVAERAIDLLRTQGAIVVDPAEIATAEEMYTDPPEDEVLQYEFRAGIDAYLAERGDPQVRSLADLIRFDDEHPDAEMMAYGQDLFLLARDRGPLDDPEYLDAVERSRRLSREEGIDATLERDHLDALFLPTGSPAEPLDLTVGESVFAGNAKPAAMAGYPVITVPAGTVQGLPVGMSFFGRPWSEALLLRLASGFERAAAARRPPGYRTAPR